MRWNAGAPDRFKRGITERDQIVAYEKAEANLPLAENLVPVHDIGTLEKLIDIFMDIFSEVASYLSPVDLLQLSRASRKLRNLLLSRQSKHIWKASRDAIEMPPCPDDLSEPRYASLVFETNCDVGKVVQVV